MNRRHVFAVILLFVSSVGVSAESVEHKPSGWRRHFEIGDKNGIPLYEVTEITRLSDIADEKLLLVRDEGHGDFIIRKIWNFETQIVQHRISDVKGRAFLQLSYKMPFTSRTRLETLAEARLNPAILPQVNTVMKLETNGGTWDGSEAEWLGDPTQLRSLRHSIRSTLNAYILEAIERGRGLLFSTVEGGPFFTIAGRYAVYGTTAAEADPDPDLTPARTIPPNCDFDNAFGYPCSDKQKAFIKKATSDGTILEMY